MKQKLFFTATFFLCACMVTSQSLTMGVHGGVSVPQLSAKSGNELTEGYKSRLAPVAGVFVEYGMGPQWSLRALVNFAGQGGIRTGMQPVTNVPDQLAAMLPPGTTLYAGFRNESILNYLEVPILLKFEWGGRLGYYINAGPYLGFLLSAKQETTGNSMFYFDKNGTQPLTVGGQPFPAQSFDATTDEKDDLRKVNFGLTAGAGSSYAIRKRQFLFLDARAAYGLTPVQKDTDKNGESRTGGLFFSVGYACKLSR